MTERTSSYQGDKIRIVYDRKLCIHAAECGRAKGDLFDVRNDPWCTPNAVDADQAADIVMRCPSGSLSFERTDGGPGEPTPETNCVVVVPDGPLYIRGDLTVDGSDSPGLSTRAALCRCGQSANKPFCDNAHKKAAFKDSGAVGETGTTVESLGGPLQIKRAPNGPLLLSGNFVIRAASGRDAYTGTKAALCRCGQSANKPFCDGAHAKAGFTAD